MAVSTLLASSIIGHKFMGHPARPDRVQAADAAAADFRIVPQRDQAMYEASDASGESRPRRHQEFEDPHFHDDDEVVPTEDAERQGTRPPARRKTVRRPPPRRHYDE